MKIGKWEIHWEWGLRRKVFWYKRFDLRPWAHIKVLVLVFVTIIASKNFPFEDIWIIEE